MGTIEFHAEAPTPANDPAGMGALNYSRVAQKTLLAVVFTSIRVPVTIPWTCASKVPDSLYWLIMNVPLKDFLSDARVTSS